MYDILRNWRNIYHLNGAISILFNMKFQYLLYWNSELSGGVLGRERGHRRKLSHNTIIIYLNLLPYKAYHILHSCWFSYRFDSEWVRCCHNFYRNRKQYKRYGNRFCNEIGKHLNLILLAQKLLRLFSLLWGTFFVVSL